MQCACARVATHPTVCVHDGPRVCAGSKLSMPLMVAPMAMQQMAHEDGELAVSWACRGAGTTMILSTMANYSIEQVAQAAGSQHLWFQLYVFKCG